MSEEDKTKKKEKHKDKDKDKDKDQVKKDKRKDKDKEKMQFLFPDKGSLSFWSSFFKKKKKDKQTDTDKGKDKDQDPHKIDVKVFAEALAQAFPNIEPKRVYVIVDSIIAGDDGCGGVKKVKVQDFILFVDRFLPFENSVPLANQNLLDESGQVHAWFHGKLGKEEAFKFYLVPDKNRFLVRFSSRKSLSKKLVLSYRSGEEERDDSIQFKDNVWSIAEDPDAKPFENIRALLNHFCQKESRLQVPSLLSRHPRETDMQEYEYKEKRPLEHAEIEVEETPSSFFDHGNRYSSDPNGDGMLASDS